MPEGHSYPEVFDGINCKDGEELCWFSQGA